MATSSPPDCFALQWNPSQREGRNDIREMLGLVSGMCDGEQSIWSEGIQSTLMKFLQVLYEFLCFVHSGSHML